MTQAFLQPRNPRDIPAQQVYADKYIGYVHLVYKKPGLCLGRNPRPGARNPRK